MKVLVVTNDADKLKKLKEKSDAEFVGCFRTYHFKEMLKDHQPRVILTDGKCKRIDKHGQSVPCFFKPEKELRGTDIQAPVFPIMGWKIWLKIVKLYDKIMPFSPN